MDITGRTDAILVLSGAASRHLLNALSEIGLATVVRRPSVGAFAQLRRRSFHAVIIDDTDPDRDALEMVLNIRDYDESVPVVVLGADEPAMRKELLDKLHVHWLDRAASPGSIASNVQGIIDDGPQGAPRRIGV